MNTLPIDVVIPWVDSNDPEWRKEKNKYAKMEGHPDTIDESDVRYRDWDTVKYLLRSIDMYMPWVHKVFFVTWGHVPAWMNTHEKKLRIVKHTDYMPDEYLPTFSSHAIELNLHRIEDLSEQFIYFNDDYLVMQPLKATDFFKKGMPRDFAIMCPLISSHRYSVQDINLTNIELINDHFDKNTVIKKNLFKWVNIRYGKQLLKSACLMPWSRFSALLTLHQCHAFLKSTFYEVWEKEFSVLDSTSRHKFRTNRDVNQWLMRYWQIASGNFKPISPSGRLYGLGNNNEKVFKALEESKFRTICLNDNGVDKISDFDKTKAALIEHMEKRFPKKSRYEK